MTIRRSVKPVTTKKGKFSLAVMRELSKASKRHGNRGQKKARDRVANTKELRARLYLPHRS